MCEYISWKEKNGEILFLDYHDIYKTKKGRELQAYCQNKSDLVGHGAIERFYGITGGINKECTNFSSPDNFPVKVVNAIKSGKMCHYIPDKLGWLLNADALAEYRKIEQPAFWKLFKNKKNRTPAWQ